jgi:16S rRNA (guanine(966)-N(2))-methyltransferase RsmD
MRIIAGKYRSRILEAPKGSKTRPTTDRAREALFNALANRISFQGLRVLDLFAGSGALGFEALSREAGTVTFVENDRTAQRSIMSNAKTLGVEDRVKVVPQNVYSFVTSQSANSSKQLFDMILSDAPYEDERAIAELPGLLIEGKLLNLNGLIVIEHRFSDAIVMPLTARLVREITAGEASFSILMQENPT